MDIMNLKENMGTADRLIRAVLAVIFVVAYFNGFTSGWAGLASIILATIFLGTSISGVCPFYALFHLRTKWKQVPH
jgi:drug/metabolite transporter (DMT)-like permease